MLGDSKLATERLLQAFSQTSAIGFAVLDDDLRFEAVNHCLAAIHRIPAGAILGRKVEEVLREAGVKAASHCQRVLATGESLQFEITNTVLPTKTKGAYWRLKICFPIRARAESIHEVGLLAVDVTNQRRLEKIFLEVAANLDDMQSHDNWWLARDLHEAIEEYHFGLGLNLDLLVRDRETSAALLAQSVEQLDQNSGNAQAIVQCLESPVARTLKCSVASP